MSDVRVPSYGDLECRSSSVTVKMKWESTSSNSRNMVKKKERSLKGHFEHKIKMLAGKAKQGQSGPGGGDSTEQVVYTIFVFLHILVPPSFFPFQ